jgi:hypothetical protein
VPAWSPVAEGGYPQLRTEDRSTSYLLLNLTTKEMEMDSPTSTIVVPVECYVSVTEGESADEIVKAALESDDRIYLAKATSTEILVAR